MKVWIQAAVALCVSCLFCPANADVYRPDGARWSVQIPAGWEVAEDQIREEFQAFFDANPAIGAFTVKQVFIPPRTDDDEFRMLLICTVAQSFRGATWDQVERALGISTPEEAERSLKQRGVDTTNMTFDGFNLNRETARLDYDFRTQTDDHGELVGVTATYLGNDYSVRFCGYTSPERLDADRAIFESVFATFQFDAGEAFVPRSPSRPISPAVVGGVVGALVAMVIIARNRKKRAEERNNDESTFPTPGR